MFGRSNIQPSGIAHNDFPTEQITFWEVAVLPSSDDIDAIFYKGEKKGLQVHCCLKMNASDFSLIGWMSSMGIGVVVRVCKSHYRKADRMRTGNALRLLLNSSKSSSASGLYPAVPPYASWINKRSLLYRYFMTSLDLEIGVIGLVNFALFC